MLEDVIVIGGGPAGAACALWAHQLGMRVLLLEAGPVLGGLQLRNPNTNQWMPGLRGKTGQEIAASLQSHLEEARVAFLTDFTAVKIQRNTEQACWEVANERDLRTARYVVIATGATPRRGEFVESDCVGIGPGVSMARIAVADKRVAILGGGDNAFDTAIFALRGGACLVDIYSRRAPRAQPILQSAMARRHVHIGPFHADQSRMSVNGVTYDVMGVQFGYEACIPGELHLPQRDGYINVDRRGAVQGFPGLFAAGEVTGYWHPCVTTSYAHGVQVAKSIQAELLTGSSISASSAIATPASARVHHAV